MNTEYKDLDDITIDFLAKYENLKDDDVKIIWKKLFDFNQLQIKKYNDTTLYIQNIEKIKKETMIYKEFLIKMSRKSC
jgi:dihydropteroate synthase